MRQKDPLSIANLAAEKRLFVEADVVDVRSETRTATVRLRNTSQEVVINLGVIDPSSIWEGRSRLLVYVDPAGGPVIPIAVVPTRIGSFVQPSVVLGDHRGGTSFSITNNFGDVVFSVDSMGNVTMGSYNAYNAAYSISYNVPFVTLAHSAYLTEERVLTNGLGTYVSYGPGGGYVSINLLYDTPIINTIRPDDVPWAGISSYPAHSDHEHGIECGPPTTYLSVSTANQEGGGTYFARSDHLHGIETSSNPGAAEAILASNAQGRLQLTGLGIGAAPASDDLHFGTGQGVTHDDGVTDGQVLRANGTRYVPASLDIDDLTDMAYAVPSLTFGTSNVEGSADSVIRSDATVLAFDATNPTTITVSSTPVVGTATVAARRDHEHGITTASNPGAAASILASSAAGKLTLVDLALTSLTASTVIYSNASKEIASLANASGYLKNDGAGALSWDASTVTPHDILSTSHSDTTADSVVRGDVIIGKGATPTWARLPVSIPAATYRTYLGTASGDTEPGYKDLFDATVPGTIQPDDNAATGSATVAARRDHTHAIVCAIAGNITPDASAAEGSASSFARSDHTHGITCAAPTTNLSVSTTNAEGAGSNFVRDSHTHAINSNSNPGAAASLLASAADGGLQLLRLGIGVDPDTSNAIKVADDAWIGLGSAAGRLVFDSTPDPDQIDVTAADVYFATASRGIIHVDGVTDGMVLRANGTRFVPATLDIGDLTDLAYATPNFTFSTSNAAGSADSVIRSDATIALFDATNPTTITVTSTASPGSAGVAARRDHNHGITTSSSPGQNDYILATNSSGYLELYGLGLRSGTPTATNPFRMLWTTGTGSLYPVGMSVQMYSAYTGSSTNEYWGLYMPLQHQDTQNHAGGWYGINLGWTNNAGSGNIDYVHGIRLAMSPNATGGTITDGYFIRLNNVSNASKYDDLFGLHIGNISGASTQSWGIYSDNSSVPSYHAGQVLIGTITTGTPKLHVVSTSEQLRLGHDGSNYASFTVSSGGDLTFDTTGNDILPASNYDLNLGSVSKKMLTMHTAELVAGHLVAENTASGIGGRVLLAPTCLFAADLASGTTNSAEKLLNIGFENAGLGGADVFANWTESAGDGTIGQDAVVFHGGTKSCKLASGATSNTLVYQNIVVADTDQIIFGFWTQGDGTNAGRYRVYDVTNGANIVATTSTGVTAATWTKVWIDFDVPLNCVLARVYFYCPAVNAAYAYFDDVTARTGVQITVTDDDMADLDIAYAESDGKVEWFEVASAATASGSNWTYWVLRDLDGGGENTWYAGDALHNTGVAGESYIEVFGSHETSILGTSYNDGAAIVLGERQSSTYNDISEVLTITGGKLTAQDVEISSLTASTAIYSDANKEITSLANASGYLYNNGAGSLSWKESGTSPYGFVPLVTPYTNASFNGDAFSSVGSNTKIENTSWSSTIPAGATALLVRCDIRDSGSGAGLGLSFRLYGSSGATTASLQLWLQYDPNDYSRSETAIVPCTDGDVWYQCTASGTNTLDVWLWCFGYWI